ncbi:M15 family metallopeptidase [Vibrio sp. 99-8-1]|uniref:M15 family metallopeptidase n=1 Tax=Vibrio sp. 99-8-1 TaxID=2607602 RepID=UPI00149387A8|nr:M15 family metallopeptidase [Vibrio sp. 99-8-1]NOI66645.1 M15 family metallopeptidase [Vibrio sp. 99-8-1]
MTPEQLTGRVDTHLQQIDTGYQSVVVHHSIIDDLQALVKAATAEGFHLHIASGFRDYQRQSYIWNRKYQGLTPILDSNSLPLEAERLTAKEKIYAILRWSALPGASRHHWGTDFDLFAKNCLAKDETLKLEPWEYFDGSQSAFYQWLISEAGRFGFFFPYAKDQGGVAIEPWHISHRLVSTHCLSQLSLTDIRECLDKEPILGAAHVLQHLEHIYSNYISNITTEI